MCDHTNLKLDGGKRWIPARDAMPRLISGRLTYFSWLGTWACADDLDIMISSIHRSKGQPPSRYPIVSQYR